MKPSLQTLSERAKTSTEAGTRERLGRAYAKDLAALPQIIASVLTPRPVRPCCFTCESWALNDLNNSGVCTRHNVTVTTNTLCENWKWDGKP